MGANDAPIDVGFAPQRRHPHLPVEVVDRAELMDRIAGRELASRQRTSFHQLLVCTSGTGSHSVDFQEIEMSPGTALRIHPGQVQRIIPDPHFDATLLIWPIESHHQDPMTPLWYPGSGAATRWQLDDTTLGNVLGWLEELRAEQERFNGTERYISLMRALLCALLLRLAIAVPESAADESRLPQPYIAYRAMIEERLHERPTVLELASDLGYSSRTLDRACQQATGQTAKQILDERVALEVRRLLTHTTRPLTQVASDLGFTDPSNFSKFVKRHLGQLPGEVRGAIRQTL